MTARTITSLSELEALPVGSVVMDRDRWPMWRTSREGWCASNGTRGIEWPEIERDGIPLTVLHDPSAPVVPVASDAAVEAGVEAARKRLASPSLHWGQSWIDPEAWPHVMRAALSAGLPLLAAAPSATREDIEGAIYDVDAASGEAVLEPSEIAWLADGLLARFTITPRTDR